MRKFRSAMALVLVLALAFTAFSVFAEEPACVKAYRVTNGVFMTKLESLRKLQNASHVGEFVGIVGGVACLAKRRSLAGILLCGTVGGVIAVPSAAFDVMTGREMNELKETYELEDVYVIYSAYFAQRSGVAMVSDDVKAFLGAVNVDPSNTKRAMEELANLMESGELCDGGDTPRANLKTVGEMIRQKLSQ